MPNHPMRTSVRILIVFVALAVTACGQGTDDTITHASTAADAGIADRVIELKTTDDLRFEPSDLTVAAGETITFRLINDGALMHDFTLGDEETQIEHEAEMSDMGAMAHDEPNVAIIPPGETVELTWTFSETGTVLIGCHQPGHYAAGMTGRIKVET